ncbi:MAG: hypothetical protein M3552_15650 [Planctomycetota bacterium]|nr:hypothetical protein [Planctomycetota bacterium]
MHHLHSRCIALVCLALASCAEQSPPGHADAPKAKSFGPPSLAIGADSSGSTDEQYDPVVAPKPSRNDVHRELAVGVWQQEETGVRWLRVRPDGTATMFIDPDWIAKAVIGNGLTVQIEWTIADGRVLMKSISGEPSTTFKAVSTIYGTDRDRAIERLDAESFIMLDDSDGSKSEWERVKPGAPLPKEIAE